MPPPKSKERRRTQRQSLGRLANMFVGDDEPPTPCLVHDFSDEGVRVTTLPGFSIPDTFLLRFLGNGLLKNGTYRVVWRNGHNVGAKLVDDVEEDHPPLHEIA